MKTEQTMALVRHIRTFVSACKLRDNLPDILSRYGVENLADLRYDDALELFRWMELAHRCKTSEPQIVVRRMRSKVLTLLGKIGIGEGNNWVRINSYLLQPKICGKLLYMLDLQELQRLEKKLYGIIEKQKRQAAKLQNESSDATPITPEAKKESHMAKVVIPINLYSSTLPN